MIPVLCYKTHQAAQQALDALAAKKIHAHLSEHAANDGGTMSCVSVDEAEETNAVKLVEENQLTTDIVRCPSCESANVEYPSAPQASPTMHLVDKVMDAIAGNEHGFICKSCSNVWT